MHWRRRCVCVAPAPRILMLHDHVRYEERHLFALLEERLSDDELARLGAAIEHAEPAG